MVPSPRAKTIGDALGIFCGPMRVELAPGAYLIDDGDALEAIERELTFVGVKGKTQVRVCENLVYSFRNKTTRDGVYVQRERHRESRFLRGIKHFFKGLIAFFSIFIR